MKRKLLFSFVTILIFSATYSQNKPRARDLGIPFEGKPGKLNSITDVPGVEVGYKTLIKDSVAGKPGKGSIRTGVTVILPLGKTPGNYPAAYYSLNGDGEMTGIPYVEDYGFGYGAIGITNTNSVGIVRDAIGEWNFKRFSKNESVDFSFGLPIVGETWDGALNDISGLHVKKEHVWEAMDNAKNGAIQEGSEGGGTGMCLYDFKGGNGTASRVFTIDSVQYSLGVFVQANFGRRDQLVIAGVPVGKEIVDLEPIFHETTRTDGSIIAIVVTNAPLLPSQLKQVAKRITHGIARTGTYSMNGSGEIFLAVSTARPTYNKNSTEQTWKVIPKWHLDPIYKATAEATEEAIINVLVAAGDMEGHNKNKWFGMPHERLRAVMKKYNRLSK